MSTRAQTLAHAMTQIDALVLDRSLRSDVRQILRSVSRELDGLYRQEYHQNPYTPFRIVGTIGTDVHSIAYKHAKDGKLYKHDFDTRSAQVIAVERHGKHDLLITSPEGIPLWDEF